jgi:hypothetical protein
MSERFDQTGRGVDAPARPDSPEVWLLVGEKRGDNTQVRNLAEAIGWAADEKQIVVAPEWPIS